MAVKSLLVAFPAPMKRGGYNSNLMNLREFDIVVIGGGHAGAEAAWAAANMGARTALVTMDPARIGQMSCNPAIGGLAKGQMVREIDALGGLMGLAIDATGIQFKMLNSSKGPAVRGPRAQADKYAYAREVQRLLSTRVNLTILCGTVEDLLVEDQRCAGVLFKAAPRVTQGPGAASPLQQCEGLLAAVSQSQSHFQAHECTPIRAGAVVLTTGTFMRGLMHRGPSQSVGGRIDESAAQGISDSLKKLGFELGRLKTGTPPRLACESLRLDALEPQPGDEFPLPFSDLSGLGTQGLPDPAYARIAAKFPCGPQAHCWITSTTHEIHQTIRANLHRAPMYNGQITTSGPRYCPSIEDKVIRFADKEKHTVFLEPESLQTNEIYCNGISTSLPQDVQEFIVHHMPGSEDAKILRYGYAVEYDMVWPHQIDVTGMTKRLPGLLLAGQINGTTGYEEAAGQGIIAGINAVRFVRGQDPVRLRRDQAYIGVLMDDLVTKVPREPYRMFTSRAEHRLLLRSDNAPERLTALGRELGLVNDHHWSAHQSRQAALAALEGYLKSHSCEGVKLYDWVRRPQVDEQWLLRNLPGDDLPPPARDLRTLGALISGVKYAPFVERHRRDQHRMARMESRGLPVDFDYTRIKGLRNEAVLVLGKFRPATYGQAARLAGINPADLTVLAFALEKAKNPMN